MNHNYGINMEFVENKANLLVIENPVLMRLVVEQIKCQIEGTDGSWIISENNKVKVFQKVCYLIADPLNLDFNSTKIQSKLYQALKEQALETLVDETAEINRQITLYIEKVIQNSQFILEYDLELDFPSLLKNYHVGIGAKEGEFVENFLTYLRLQMQLMQKPVAIMVSLKSWVTESELSEIYAYAFYNKIDIVLIESNCKESSPQENVTVVDSDGCVIQY